MAEFWRFGATPCPAIDVRDHARRFEALGWDGLAVGEDHGLLAAPWVYLAQAAASTTKLKLGTGVAVPIRDPLLTASAVATLHAMSAGRVVLSVGRGDGAMAQLGRGPVSVSDFLTYVEQVRGYLHSEVVDRDGFPSTMATLFANDPSLVREPAPVDVSATGPRVIRAAAGIADGITFAVGADTDRLRALVEMAREARREAGLDLDGFRLGAYVPAAVAPNGDRSLARSIVRGAVLRHARFSAFEGELLDDVAPADRDGIRIAFDVTRDHDRNVPKPADFSVADALPDDFVDRFAVIGERRECAERIEEIIATGIERLLLITRVPTTDPGEDNAARLAQEVLPLVAGA